jgi:iron complex transport system substrate-binding protein
MGSKGVLGLLLGLCLHSVMAQAQPRVVSLSPDVTEVLVALHAQPLLVGRDMLARQAEVARVPVIGSSRALTVAPVLAVKPDLVLGSSLAQPLSIFDQLTHMGLHVVSIRHADSPADFAQGMRQIGLAVGRGAQADRLAAAWLKKFQPQPVKPGARHRILFSYDGRLVAGKGTAGDALIRAAGGVNAAEGLQGFVPMTPEAWMRAAPDVVIVAAHNLAVFGGLDALKARPELRTSPAVQSGRVYAWPAADFLRLGVDSPQTISRLHQLLI